MHRRIPLTLGLVAAIGLIGAGCSGQESTATAAGDSSLAVESGELEPIGDPGAVLSQVLTTPLVDQFETARFAVSSPLPGSEASGPEQLEGSADLREARYLWNRDGEPVLYRDGSAMYERAEQFGESFWVARAHDPTSLGTVLALPWPGPIDAPVPSAAIPLPTDPVEDLGPASVRGEPVRQLTMQGRQTVGGDRLLGDEVTPEQEVDYTLHLYVDSQLRPRGVDYSLWFLGEEIPVSIEFWDLDADVVVEEPTNLSDPPPERPESGPAGTTELRVSLDGHTNFGPITRELDPETPHVSFQLDENPLDSGFKPGQLTAKVLSQPDDAVARLWEITILPETDRVTAGTYPVVSSLLSQDPGTAVLRLDEYFCGSDEQASLVVHEVEFDDFGPSRFQATFEASCPSARSGQYYPEIEGELRINALSG